MSVVIVGGNECMERQYKDLCREYACKAKVFPKTKSNMKSIGQPDLLVLFTNTVSHKMVRCALNAVKGQDIPIVRCHSSSANALKSILEKYALEN